MTSIFKVGDKVKVTANTANSQKQAGWHIRGQGVVNIGAIGVIDSISEGFAKVKFDKEHIEGKTGSDPFRKLRFDEIELVGSKPSKNQRITALEETVAKQGEEISELKLIVAQIRKPSTIVEEALTAASVEDAPKRLTVGDIAKVIKKVPLTNTRIGDTVKIVHDAEDSQPYRCELLNGESAGYFREDELERYSDTVIEFEGAQYKKVDREAREGDVVIFPKLHKSWNDDISENKPYRVSMLCGEAKFEDDAGDPMSVYGGYTGYDDVASVLVYELFGAKPQMEGERLVKQCEQHFPPVEKSPNEKRAEMIEKAKMFVDENGGDEYHFDIDENKGTVFAYKVITPGVGRYGVKQGFSECHPNDVFNADIGKAISFGRAEKLDVSEFEQAVQPTDFIKGQLVKYANSELLEVDHVRKNEFSEKAVYFTGGTWMNTYELTIINDSNAIYGGGE